MLMCFRCSCICGGSSCCWLGVPCYLCMQHLVVFAAGVSNGAMSDESHGL